MKEEIFKDIKGTIIEQILDNLPILFFAKDLDNNYIFTNKEIERMTGFSKEKMLSTNISDLFPDGDKYLEDDLRVAKEGKVERFDESYYNSEGKLRWVDTTKFPLKDDNGETVGIIAASIDITDKKEVQQIADEIANQNLFGVLIISLDGKVLFCNEEMGVISKRTVDEIMNWEPMKFMELIDKQDRQAIADRIKARINGKEISQHYEFKAYKSDNSPMWLNLYSKKIKWKKEEAILIFFVERTERIKAQLELEDKRRELDHLRNLIMHDITNHSNNIGNAAELGLIYFERNVGKKLCDEKCGELFKIIQKNTQILNDLIKKIKIT